MPLLTIFFLGVGLALGWGVRRFHNNSCMFSSPTEFSISQTPHYYVPKLTLFGHWHFFCSSARGSFLVLSVAGHAGGPRDHWVQAWALGEVRGTCSGVSKPRKLVNNHGIDFRPARANQAPANPKNKSGEIGLYFRPTIIVPEN